MSHHIQEIKVARFETYPADEPTSYAVGFDVNLENGRAFYIDTQVPFADVVSTATNDEIAQQALDALRTQIESRGETEGAKASVVGQPVAFSAA